MNLLSLLKVALRALAINPAMVPASSTPLA